MQRICNANIKILGDKIPHTVKEVINLNIGEKIKELRKAKGLTQKQLGEHCNMSDALIRTYEKGVRVPKIETLDKIASGLGIPLMELLDNTPYRKYFDKKE